MEQPIVRHAAEAYQSGDYVLALQLYKQAASRLGEKFFRVNVILCQRKLGASQLGKNYSETPLRKIRVACVMDEFSYTSYKDTCTLHHLSIDNWESELNEFHPDILFIESAWRGKDDEWTRKISQASSELLGAIGWCKQRNITTMFWNKEDPIHYGTFLNTAKRFDHVFTTDLNCIGNYKRDLGHENVYVLPFACNPIEHGPVEKYQRKPKACFAGSYYVRYPERLKDLDVLLGTLIEHGGVDIYDRNFGKEDVNYAFPEKYAPLILGNLKYDQIDLAYKGYDYGINLNSVKYSSTMFARRVYELLASNTIVVSNYSKGVRLQFGDLVIASDDKSEVSARLEQLSTESLYGQKVKLAGLRKVMSEHTYEDRFAYITEKILGRSSRLSSPVINVLAVATTSTGLHKTIEAFRRQRYEAKVLHVLLNLNEITVPGPVHVNERLIDGSGATDNWTTVPEDEYAALIDPDCYYGEHYLSDLALAKRYSNTEVVAKGTINDPLPNSCVETTLKGNEYTYGSCFYYHASLLSSRLAANLIVSLRADNFDPGSLINTADDSVLFIDRFNYVDGKRQQSDVEQLLAFKYSDLANLDTGVSMTDLLRCAEAIQPATKPTTTAAPESTLPGADLHTLLNVAAAKARGIVCSISDKQLKLDVSADAEAPYYIYTNAIHPVERFWRDRSGKLFLETTPGLELSPVVIFFDESKKRLNHAILIANWNQVIVIPSNARFVRLGIRVAGGPGQASVANWVFDHASQEDRFAWMPSSPLLMIAPNYPAYGAYYRYAFVHRRVRCYKDSGLKLDVFRFRQGADLEFYEFENVDVISGGSDALDTVMRFGSYSTIAIHALDKALWEVVSKHLESKKIIIWLHGSEVQSWQRRMFNYDTESEIERARGNGEQRDQMWRDVFSLKHSNMHFVFVSQHFCREVIDDLLVTAPADNVHIIHNPIDTSLFDFYKKLPEQRLKVLSIRPYASRVYANDIMVEAILELSARACFEEFEFLIVGDGVLFDDTVLPLKQFANVEIRKGFLSQREIASLHREYGVFLCPSRMDTQGVSRDEAMSSGLVPITNKVGAISEFVDDRTGFLCEPENFVQMANSMETLYHDPQLFSDMSTSAASAVRESRSAALICAAEMALLCNDVP
ncbi:MAG: glycosyltransferase [Candidatus Accumulibacter delftensis]|jgi:glycosyltransferase involved in cell wall biosynthesis